MIVLKSGSLTILILLPRGMYFDDNGVNISCSCGGNPRGHRESKSREAAPFHSDSGDEGNT